MEDKFVNAPHGDRNGYFDERPVGGPPLSPYHVCECADRLRLEIVMRRFFLLLPLMGALMLLTACPDSKRPTPTPKVPTPKAEPQALLLQLAPVPLRWQA